MEKEQFAIVLVSLGSIFLASLAVDMLGRRTRLPRVTLLLLLGVVVGPIGLDLLPETSLDWFPFIAHLALVMVAFLLGGELTPSFLRGHGWRLVGVSGVVVGVTALVLMIGLLVGGWPVEIALLLGAIATSTDPAAVSDVVREVGAKGDFPKTLLGIVAIDDAWGILVVSLALAAVLGMQSPDAARLAVLDGLVELGGAVAVGVLLGVPIALLSGRVREGEPTLAEALGGVILCAGLSLFWGVSYLLAAMTMGAVVANLARHHRRPFRAIEGIEWPFMLLFFVLSGASLRTGLLAEVALLTGVYIGLRVLGRIAGGWAGARLAGQPRYARSLGIALLPQAGVAIGMALVVSEHVPDVGPEILGATVTATIFFEIVGPILTRRELDQIGAHAAD
jgi:Kef-type K+ transport system membrane component KefB